MSYNTLSGTIQGPNKIIAKKDGTFTQITGSVSGSFVNASGTLVSFASIGTVGGSGGAIGESEDGSYADGLFTDFTTGTMVGVVLDRYNEIFKSLVPPPAPNLSRAFTAQDGTDVRLSFGASNDMESDGTPYYSVTTSAGGTAVDKGELYGTQTFGNNFRIAAFQGTTAITGVINDQVTASVLGSYTNYVANAFGNANTGTLALYINSTSSAAHTLNLATATGTGNPGSGNSSSLNADGSGFIKVSIAKNATDANNNSFDIFKHRTANFVVNPASQRMGWNYAYVKHTVGSANYTSNFIEWVNDANAVTPTITSQAITGITLNGSRYLSGVQYNLSASADYSFLISHFYKNVYLNASVICVDLNGRATITDTTMPHIGADDENKTVALTQSLETNVPTILNATVGAQASVSHIFKGTANANTSVSGFLIYTPTSNNPTNTVEYFRNEKYRLPSGSHDAQGTIATSSWTSATHMTGSGTHADGLIIYNEALRSPKQGANGGNFAAIANTESGNPDYSSVTGVRTFYRAFKNTGAAKQDVSITINGTGTIVSNGAELGANNKIRVLVKTPGKTGWMNLADAYSHPNLSDGAGARETNFDSSLNATNIVTLGAKAVATNEWFLVKIEAHANWTGNISQISVTFGAGTGGITNPSNLSQLDETMANNGSNAVLSFGASKPIAGYTSATGTPSINGAVDLNGLWEPNTGFDNQRLGVYDKTFNITGKLNSVITSARLSDAHTGSLELYINGALRHTVNLNSYGDGNTLNSSGSGFQSLSAVKYPKFGNQVSDYTKPYRTGSVIVDADDQRDGWNFARVKHSGTFGERTSTYIEWMNDSNASTISVAGGNISNFNNSNVFYSSGIKSFRNPPTASFTLTSSNNYLNTYDGDPANAIDFNDSLTNVTISAMTASGAGINDLTDSNGVSGYPTLNTTTNSQTASVNYNLTLSFTPSFSLVGAFVGGAAIHTASIGSAKFLQPPVNGNNNTYSTFTTSDFTSFSKAGFLVFSGSGLTTNSSSIEAFTSEEFRLQNKGKTYDAQTDTTASENKWNAQYSVNDGTYPSHQDGLVVFGEKLLAPPKAGVSGDCRNIADGGTLQAPSGNPNYALSGLTDATRTYVRFFKNTTGGDKTNIQIQIYGSGTLDDLGASYANGNFKLEYKFPSSDASVNTAWLDAGKNSQSGNKNVDGEGGVTGVGSGYFPLTISAEGTTIGASPNYVTLLGGAWENNKYLLIRVRASASWNGWISRIEVT